MPPDSYKKLLYIYDRELWKSIDELSAERDEVIGNLLNICGVISDRFVHVTESCSNWVVYE